MRRCLAVYWTQWPIKLDLRLIIYSHSPTNRENLAKTAPVDFGIVCLTGIVKNANK